MKENDEETLQRIREYWDGLADVVTALRSLPIRTELIDVLGQPGVSLLTLVELPRRHWVQVEPVLAHFVPLMKSRRATEAVVRTLARSDISLETVQLLCEQFNHAQGENTEDPLLWVYANTIETARCSGAVCDWAVKWASDLSLGFTVRALLLDLLMRHRDERLRRLSGAMFQSEAWYDQAQAMTIAKKMKYRDFNDQIAELCDSDVPAVRKAARIALKTLA